MDSGRAKEKFDHVLFQLSKQPAITAGDLETSVKLLLEAASSVIHASRSSIWLVNSDKNDLECLISINAQNEILHPVPIHLADYPDYTNLLASGRFLCVADLRNGDTALPNYHTLTGTCALLDAPCRLQGELVGVVDFEHDEPREWTEEEQAFASSLADFAALAIEAARRKDARAQLEESRRQYASLLSNVPGVVYQCKNDFPNFTFTFVSEGATKLFGYTPEELIGNKAVMFLDLVHPDDRERLEEENLNTLCVGKPLDAHFRIIAKDGQIRWLWERSHVVEAAPDGTPLLIEGFYTDVSAQADAENAKERAEAQLRQAHKMEAVGHLAGGIAHDFNNLLQVIMSNLDEVDVQVTEKFIILPELNEIRKAAKRAAKLTRQLLAFGRRQILQPKITDMNKVVLTLNNMIRHIISEKINLQCETGDIRNCVNADKTQVEQALINLCVNACDAMPDGGDLTITTLSELIDDTHPLFHKAIIPGLHVGIRISDQGVGIPPENLSRVFDPFFTTKPVGEGSGLGLSMAYGVVQQHQGIIDVQSIVGQGTTFTLWFPVVAAEPVMPAHVPLVAEGGTETILLAEDELALLNITANTLRNAGYTVLTAADGDEAIRIFDQNPGQIDMAVLDVMMPKCGGKEVMEHIQAKDPGVKYLFISGYSEKTIHDNFVINPGLRLLPKPYDRAVLLSEIRTILADEAANDCLKQNQAN